MRRRPSCSAAPTPTSTAPSGRGATESSAIWSDGSRTEPGQWRTTRLARPPPPLRPRRPRAVTMPRVSRRPPAPRRRAPDARAPLAQSRRVGNRGARGEPHTAYRPGAAAAMAPGSSAVIRAAQVRSSRAASSLVSPATRPWPAAWPGRAAKRTSSLRDRECGSFEIGSAERCRAADVRVPLRSTTAAVGACPPQPTGYGGHGVREPWVGTPPGRRHEEQRG